MNLHEKINHLLTEKSMPKKEFVNRVRLLEPRLNQTGEIPSEQTIYRYLSGKRDIKVEMIPYFAEVLDISISDLFSFDIDYACENNTQHSKEAREMMALIKYIPIKTLTVILNTMRRYKHLHDEELKKLK